MSPQRPLNTPTPPASISKMRTSAVYILKEVILRGHSLNASQQPALIQELCYGVLRWYWQLNGIADMLLQHPLKAKDQDLKIVIMLGIYQLMYMRIAAHAALNETVNVARELKKPWAVKFINGVLREFQRQQNTLQEKINNSVVLKYAHPKWLIKLLQQAWTTQWQEILSANNERAPMILRVNRLKISREDYLQELIQAEIKTTAITHTTAGIMLEKPCDVAQLPGFNAGWVSVQDSAAQLAAELLELKPGLSVLDACAAPGGKTTHILETEPDLKQLTILEVDPERLQKITSNLQRLGFNTDDSRLILRCADANKTADWWNQKYFDRILIDAPCSGTGVIRRHPDIKLLRRSEDIANFAQQQMTLLNNLWPLLKPGGILLYATCSILPQENVEVVQEFLRQHSDAKEIPIQVPWGISMKPGRQLFPQINSHDGFYYAKIIKTDTIAA